jgi:NAD+ diphosphatase
MAAARSNPNYLAGPYMERLAHLRKDEARLRAALSDPQTFFVPLWRTQNLISRAASNFAAEFLRGFSDFETLRGEPILLGEFRSQLCFAIELPDTEPPALDLNAEFMDLRTVASDLDRDEGGILSYARAMVLWRERHRFCGRCGSPTVATQAGHVLVCTNDQCKHQQFPRTDPAIIVLVTDGERALLGRQASWPAGRYSTIAGFVEPGESLEDAVRREVLEETGVPVGEVEYHSSQPWPFPSSLMLGFTAHAIGTDIRQVDDELEDVRWLTRSQIAAGEVALPNPVSISFRLIEDWYDAGSAVPLREEPDARLWLPANR